MGALNHTERGGIAYTFWGRDNCNFFDDKEVCEKENVGVNVGDADNDGNKWLDDGCRAKAAMTGLF